MYSDPRSIRRPARDRLGTSFHRSFPPVIDRQGFLRRQHQDVKWSNGFCGENYRAPLNDVSIGSKASQLKEDVIKSSRNRVSSTSDVQKIAIKNDAHTSKVAFTKLNGSSAKEAVSAKKAAVLSASAPASGEKNHIKVTKLTVETFLRKLCLSKYLITFQAEEVDMFALMHMTDDDFKSLGLPMGPRKKILCALANLKAKKREAKTKVP